MTVVRRRGNNRDPNIDFPDENTLYKKYNIPSKRGYKVIEKRVKDYEKNISTKQNQTRENTWVFKKNVDQSRAQDCKQAQGQG